eukprot:Nitzschia sp. Nitz4//scaffold9_size221794//205220//206935//NITZ4_001386-RA/size221794-processed-gene-0.294-mRNA-1//1//CDS//3329561121//6654//frame0
MASTTFFSQDELDEVVEVLKDALKDKELRKLSQRAVQAKLWHLHPQVPAIMQRIRQHEESIKQKAMSAMSELIFKFNEHTLDVSLARAGILHDKRVHAGSSLDKTECFDIFCLDAKERLYLIMKNYGWLEAFFRLYPLHFYENSFQFVDNIPQKKLKVKVNVVGLGIGGSMTMSGLAKAGIDAVGYEKRNEKGPSSVGSRYQNASFRAYDVAGDLLDQEAYDELIKYRQRFTVQYDDGTSGFITSDRVQIILGHAVEQALASAKRYGANLKFGVDDVISELQEGSDIVALFTGAHTSYIFPEIQPEMKTFSWDDISSDCKMWLRIKPSEKEDFYCTRGGEVGAEVWDYTIESARDTVEDIVRVRNYLKAEYNRELKKAQDEAEKEKVVAKYEAQLRQLTEVQSAVEEGQTPGGRFDYIFTNAPTNSHNISKREEAGADGSIVLNGGYKVDVKIAENAKFTSPSVRDKFKADYVVCGGDACVPPNPQAAYGATLACDTASLVVKLATSVGHMNSIIEDMSKMGEFVDEQWLEEVVDLKNMFTEYFNASARAENYFQFIQTLMCNLYALPAED